MRIQLVFLAALVACSGSSDDPGEGTTPTGSPPIDTTPGTPTGTAITVPDQEA